MTTAQAHRARLIIKIGNLVQAWSIVAISAGAIALALTLK